MYKYKTGKLVQENDICFYSEVIDDYADGIYRMEIIDGELTPRGYMTNYMGAFMGIVERDENTVPLKYCCNENIDPLELECFTLIGKSPKDDHMLTVEWASKNYKLNEDD